MFMEHLNYYTIVLLCICSDIWGNKKNIFPPPLYLHYDILEYNAAAKL